MRPRVYDGGQTPSSTHGPYLFGYITEQPGCVAHCVMFRLEHAGGVPLHSVKVQPLFSQAGAIVWVEQASGVPVQPSVQLQPLSMLQAP